MKIQYLVSQKKKKIEKMTTDGTITERKHESIASYQLIFHILKGVTDLLTFCIILKFALFCPKTFECWFTASISSNKRRSTPNVQYGTLNLLMCSSIIESILPVISVPITAASWSFCNWMVGGIRIKFRSGIWF